MIRIHDEFSGVMKTSDWQDGVSIDSRPYIWPVAWLLVPNRVNGAGAIGFLGCFPEGIFVPVGHGNGNVGGWQGRYCR